MARGGIAGRLEEYIALVVLKPLGRYAVIHIEGLDVVVGEVVNRKDVARVDFGAAPLVTDGDDLAFGIRHCLHIGNFAGYDLDRFRVESGNYAQVLQRMTVECSPAVVGFVRDIVLNESGFDVSAGNQVAVRYGSIPRSGQLPKSLPPCPKWPGPMPRPGDSKSRRFRRWLWRKRLSWLLWRYRR